jgi:hypothetical protein
MTEEPWTGPLPPAPPGSLLPGSDVGTTTTPPPPPV